MFEFRDRTLKLNIAGSEFQIEADMKLDKLIMQRTRAAADIVKQFCDDEKSDAEVIAFYKRCFAEILNDEKAADRIFINRVPDAKDCIDIMEYIASEATRFFQKTALTPIRGGKV
jgi:hypothetical protein